MNLRPRTWLLVVGILVALAVLEHFSDWTLYVSRSWSTTRVSSLVVARAAGADSEYVERPALRWLPFIKYGETVHILTKERIDSPSKVIADTSTTRTKLLVLGFCSPHRYEKMADEPAVKAEKKFRSPTQTLANSVRPADGRSDH